jgi:hypothetical protein
VNEEDLAPCGLLRQKQSTINQMSEENSCAERNVDRKKGVENTGKVEFISFRNSDFHCTHFHLVHPLSGLACQCPVIILLQPAEK